MVKVKCEIERDGCGMIFEVSDEVLKERYIQCPYCGRIDELRIGEEEKDGI
jgi:DNA-directed RNA polymerase subunit RPC12/RpoP